MTVTGVTNDNYVAIARECFVGGKLDTDAVDKLSAKYGFEGKLFEKCNNIFDVERALKSYAETKKA